MGLRINTNVPILKAIRWLSIHDREQTQSLERLASGLRINRGADDPSGIIISEQLRTQIAAIQAAQENTQNSINLIQTADAALAEISNRIVEIQSSVSFVLGGTATTSQIAAEQQAVDNNISAINRIASTTRFGERNLLNGELDIPIVGDIPAAVNDLKIRSLKLAPGQTAFSISMTVSAVPERGTIRFNNAVRATEDTVLRITGPRGTADINLASGTTATGLVAAINSVGGNTGVYANADATDVYVRTEEFGASQAVRLEVISGKLSGTGATDLVTATYANGAWTTEAGAFAAGEVVIDYGKNGIISYGGQEFTGVGREFSIITPTVYFQFSLNPDLINEPGETAPVVSGYTVPAITVGAGGLNIQIGEQPLPSDRLSVGIENMNASRIGFEPYVSELESAISGQANVMIGGFIQSLETGRANDLYTNPQNANRIVEEATQQVASLRGYLGSVVAGNLQPQVNALAVHEENLSASLSFIRDLDFAEETANFTRVQILFQSTIASLASANLVPQTVLALLT